MYRKILILTIILPIITAWVTGCGYKEGVLVKEPASYLWFTGNVDQASARIDEQEPFVIVKSTGQMQGPTTELLYYQISPGRHRVVVEKNGNVIVDRVLFVGNGNIQEIQVP